MQFYGINEILSKSLEYKFKKVISSITCLVMVKKSLWRVKYITENLHR